MALEGLWMSPGACRDAAAPPPIAKSGATPGRRVTLLVDAEPLAELPARDPRAAPRPGQLRPDVDRPLSA
jgi:hypothetical protein